MVTYKQNVKERSRERIWKKAIETVTIHRQQNKVLNHVHVRELWDHCIDILESRKLIERADFSILNKWFDFSSSIYGSKNVRDLKVAYLCGPEPENDLKVLINSGVKIENVWAIEKDEKMYRDALNSARVSFPNLKIFRGSVNDFVKITSITFDIIYLDFTGTLFSRETKPYSAIHAIFEEQALSDLGVLITNFSEAPKNDETIDFLSNYFFNQEFIDGSILGQTNEDGNQIDWYIEGASCYGLSMEDFRERVKENFELAYSAFCSHYIANYSNLIAPVYRTIRNTGARSKLYKNLDLKKLKQIVSAIEMPYSYDWDTFSKLDEKIETSEISVDEIAESIRDLFYEDNSHFSNWHFLKGLKKYSNNKKSISNSWFQYYENGEYSGPSRYEAVVLRDLLKNYNLNTYLIADSLVESLKKINTEMKKFDIFCDVPLSFLWTEVALNQFGIPYHSQFNNHERFNYKAQTNTMYVDIFTFDKCRDFYDWLPFIDLLSDEIKSTEKSLILRIMLDLIGGKQSGYIIPQLYWASNLVGIGSNCSVSDLFVDKFPTRYEMKDKE